MTTPTLLNDDGTASMATPIMMSHHGFRRDLGRFETALTRVSIGDKTRVEALREEWLNFRNTLHGHHAAEDNGLFPTLAQREPALAATIAQLDADHRRIDPLLESGDAAFAALPDTGAALGVIRELARLLDPHLAIEESELIPHLRGNRTFPELPGGEEDMVAHGFAWAIHGIAEEVVDQLLKILPASLCAKLPEARKAFERRCERVWGSARAGATRTPIPD